MPPKKSTVPTPNDSLILEGWQYAPPLAETLDDLTLRAKVAHLAHLAVSALPETETTAAKAQLLPAAEEHKQRGLPGFVHSKLVRELTQLEETPPTSQRPPTPRRRVLRKKAS